MIYQPTPYEAAVDALVWVPGDWRTRDAMEAILAYAHSVDEKLDRALNVNELWDGS